MGVFYFAKNYGSFYGLRVQVEINGDMHREYLSFAGATRAEQNRLRARAAELDKEWQRLRDARLLERKRTTTHWRASQHAGVGFTGITLHTSSARGAATGFGFRVTYKRKIKTFTFGRHGFEGAWKLAVDTHMRMRGIRESQRNSIDAHKPSSKQLRAYWRSQKAKGFDVPQSLCHDQGLW